MNSVNRPFNFCAGPCTLPLEVLEEAKAELTDYRGSGMSIVEQSHRGKDYSDVHYCATEAFRELLDVPDDFAILFLQGGATLQFSMVAMNILGESQSAAYVNSGHWAKLAMSDAAVYGDVYEAWSGADSNFTTMPESADEIELRSNARYLHVTSNETIGGVRLPFFPDVGVRLVADMSSDYMSRRIPWELFDITYGGAQKNLGPSGMAVVVVRKSILDDAPRPLPSYLNLRKQLDSDALFNTPPVFSIYITGKVLQWVKRNGGVDKMHENAVTRSSMLYDAIDNSGGFYTNPVPKYCRSDMNVIFRVAGGNLDEEFAAEGEKRGFLNMTGHRSVGGIRVSIYNAMPISAIEQLIDFMGEFRASH